MSSFWTWRCLTGKPKGNPEQKPKGSQKRKKKKSSYKSAPPAALASSFFSLTRPRRDSSRKVRPCQSPKKLRKAAPALLALQGCALKAERMQLALVVSLGGVQTGRPTPPQTGGFLAGWLTIQHLTKKKELTVTWASKL